MAANNKIILSGYKNTELTKWFNHYFEFENQVIVSKQSILDIECNAIVSPGNSFGFMDGGLDLQITKKYGWEIQTELKNKIQKLPLKELLVGESIILAIPNSKQKIICAPTMRVPTNEGISTSINAYLAMKAILLNIINSDELSTIAIPGLCTGTGGMSPKTAAKQMHSAFSEIFLNQKTEFPTYMDAKQEHNRLTS